MALPVGLEPTTYSLEGYCSIQLSYGNCLSMYKLLEEMINLPSSLPTNTPNAGSNCNHWTNDVTILTGYSIWTNRCARPKRINKQLASPTLIYCQALIWCAPQDLNLYSCDYESQSLPIKLEAHGDDGRTRTYDLRIMISLL